MRCPRCEGSCSVVRGSNISRLCREVIYRCRDLTCNLTFVAHIEPVRIIAGPNDLEAIGLPIVRPSETTDDAATAAA